MGFQEIKKRIMTTSKPSLLSLPTEILHTILKDLSHSKFPYLIQTKYVCKTLQEVIKSEEFLRDVDIMTMTATTPPSVTAAKFTKVCLLKGNASGIFVKGVSDFFELGRLEEGLEGIRVAAEMGYDLGLYVNAMLDRILNPKQEIRSQLTQLHRDFIRRMSKKVKKMEDVMWPLFDMRPAIYGEKVALFDWDDLFRCKSCVWRQICTPNMVKPNWGFTCDQCFMTKYILLFRSLFPKKIRMWVIADDLLLEDTGCACIAK